MPWSFKNRKPEVLNASVMESATACLSEGVPEENGLKSMIYTFFELVTIDTMIWIHQKVSRLTGITKSSFSTAVADGWSTWVVLAIMCVIHLSHCQCSSFQISVARGSSSSEGPGTEDQLEFLKGKRLR
jgi:hypothetical protein